MKYKKESLLKRKFIEKGRPPARESCGRADFYTVFCLKVFCAAFFHGLISLRVIPLSVGRAFSFVAFFSRIFPVVFFIRSFSRRLFYPFFFPFRFFSTLLFRAFYPTFPRRARSVSLSPSPFVRPFFSPAFMPPFLPAVCS